MKNDEDIEAEIIEVPDNRTFEEKYPYELFYTQNKTAASLFVYECGWQHCSMYQNYGPGKRSYYILHFVEEGCGVFTVNNKTYEVGKNQGFLVPIDVTVYYSADKTKPWHYYWVGFNGTNATELLKKAGFISGNNYVITYEKPEVIKQLMKNINSYMNRDEAAELGMVGNLILIFSTLLEGYKGVDEPHENESYIDKAVKYIDENLSRNLTVEDIASYIGFDRTYFFRLFKTKIGMSPQSFIIAKRLHKVLILLKDTDYTLNEISKMVGYDDYSNFSKIFKKKFGMTPKEYAKSPFEHKEENAAEILKIDKKDIKTGV